MGIKSHEKFLVVRVAGGPVGELYDDADKALNEAIGHENTGGAYVQAVHVPYRTDDEPQTQEEYSDWTNAQLQEELRDRGLDSTGNKAAMVERLHADDENR